MKTRRLGRTDVFVSAVGLGGWPFGGGYDWGSADVAQAEQTVLSAVSAGINFIDTAPIYGDSEVLLGRFLKGRRYQVVLATKCGLVKNGSWTDHDLRPQTIRRQLEDSLSRLQTDYIDLYQIHYPDPKVPLEDALEELVRQKQAGKIRHIGLCNMSAEELTRAAQITEVASVQNEYSLLHPQKGEAVFSACREIGAALISYGTLCGGILSGKYKTEPNFRRADARNYFYKCYRGDAFLHAKQTAERVKTLAERLGVSSAAVAVAWALSSETVSSALTGARTPEQILQNAAGADIRLTPQDLAFLEGRLCTCTK